LIDCFKGDALFDNARLVEVLDPYYRVNVTYGCTKSTMASRSVFLEMKKSYHDLFTESPLSFFFFFFCRSSRDVSLVQVVTEKANGTLLNVTGSILDDKVVVPTSHSFFPTEFSP